jgi:septal ring factor EnvC (AmiA/AmiB activator)
MPQSRRSLSELERQLRQKEREVQKLREQIEKSNHTDSDLEASQGDHRVASGAAFIQDAFPIARSSTMPRSKSTAGHAFSSSRVTVCNLNA